MATGGAPITEGRHYWEVVLTNVELMENICAIMVGAVCPGLCLNQGHSRSAMLTSSLATTAPSGATQDECRPANGLTEADRAGDAGWIRFYRNCMRWGPDFVEGVTQGRCCARWSSWPVPK
jgi:hypothetical protein